MWAILPAFVTLVAAVSAWALWIELGHRAVADYPGHGFIWMRRLAVSGLLAVTALTWAIAWVAR